MYLATQNKNYNYNYFELFMRGTSVHLISATLLGLCLVAD